MNEIRIAMWSGPRNISTAMMRSWENREDTMVVDEPFYGPYLYHSRKQHPMYKEIIENQGKDYDKVIKDLTTCRLPPGISIYYQKHMAHHILPETDLSWIVSMKNALLLRHPYEVLSSYLEKYPEASPQDLGYPQLVKIFHLIKHETGVTPPVFESRDILVNPAKMLGKMCTLLNVQFDEKMLHWPKGYRDSDGIWATHWYNSVIQSEQFAAYHPKSVQLTVQEKRIADECMPYYEELRACKIQ